MIKVSAPGKIHISGEHSVVYGQPALISAIDKRVIVKLAARKDSKIIVKDNSLKLKQTLEFPQIRRFAYLNPKAWESSDKLGLVKASIDKTYSFLQVKPEKGFELEINSQIPVGQGLGSSAALAIALVTAVLTWEKVKFDKEIISKVAWEVEKFQHGNPSGSDNTACCFGGILLYQKQKGQPVFQNLKIKTNLSGLILISSGQPEESTGEMVAKASQVKNKSIFAQMGKTTTKIINILKTGKQEHLNKLILKNQQQLESLGVVGKPAKKIIKMLEQEGVAAKICGAGGVKKGSGMILAFPQDLTMLKETLKLKSLDFIKVKVNQPGVKIEK